MKIVESYLAKATPKQKELYSALERGVRNFNNFPIQSYKTQISFKGGSHNKNICVIKLVANHLQIHFNLKKEEFSDSKDLIIRAEYGTRGMQSKANFTNTEELEYILDLIKQSYEKNKH